MPRFHFHVENSTGRTEDEEGSELADVAAARAMAVEGARSILSEEVKGGRVDLRGRIEVTGADGTVILTLPFSEAIDLRTGPPPGSDLEPGVAAHD